jgi:hypothetical protein
MAALIHHQITNALQAAAGLYHRLVLLVGEAGSGKSAVLRDIAAGYDTHVININLALAGEPLELSARQRPLRLPEILGQILDQALARSQAMALAQPKDQGQTIAPTQSKAHDQAGAEGQPLPSSPLTHHPDDASNLPQPIPLVLDNLELLFDQDLMQDPLRLLQGLSRNRTLLASWNGTFSVGRLGYAEPGHPEYRAYDAPDALIVTMDGASTLDPAP